MVASEEEGVARLLTANYAFLSETQLMSYMFKENCSIKEINVKLFPSYGHLGYAKNLPFAGMLDRELFRLVSGGVIDRLRRRWWGVAIPCEERMPFTELDFTHTVTAFLVLLTGIILAIVFFMMEKICKKILLKKHKSFCISQVKVRFRQALMTQRCNANTSTNAVSSSTHDGRSIAVDPTGRYLGYETRAQANVVHKPNSSVNNRKAAVPDR
ncbi:glutamate receptor ionotropic, kainate 2-like [Panulirus ornatus]|uniref:glutamate receptor ionotropic, kainate 2-like n=1 Tax=Panulirus ornatus TaxID=150431 RepID=UPI003A89B84E